MFCQVQAFAQENKQTLLYFIGSVDKICTVLKLFLLVIENLLHGFAFGKKIEISAFYILKILIAFLELSVDKNLTLISFH
ncbi:hypothetical protein BpHYR1_000259 [Brachionus plicatilis]|uniref:Uncharacterized protein n=1 Tax=Brachionus plicatilis TaxID=10195 RepID=A0A3M7RJF9_BRAPC|nr:hypothetical protein BpHYR1_000259 [Brachionus plicatilis]